MPYQVDTSKSVKKFVKKLQKKIKKSYDYWRTNDLAQDPLNANEGMVEKFKHKGIRAYKKRFGSTRFIYIVDEENEKVFIFQASNRDDVYD